MKKTRQKPPIFQRNIRNYETASNCIVKTTTSSKFQRNIKPYFSKKKLLWIQNHNYVLFTDEWLSNCKKSTSAIWKLCSCESFYFEKISKQKLFFRVWVKMFVRAIPFKTKSFAPSLSLVLSVFAICPFKTTKSKLWNQQSLKEPNAI